MEIIKLLEAIAAFRKEHGNTRIPRSYSKPGAVNLGKEIHQLRRDYANGKLTPDIVSAAETVGVQWNPRYQSFESGLADLAAFVEANGHCHVPNPRDTSQGTQLGRWVATQRRRGKAGLLSPERIAQLDALGFTWDVRNDQFQQGLDALDAYLAEETNPPLNEMPPGYVDAEGFNLGVWCANRRSGHTRGVLDARQERELAQRGLITVNAELSPDEQRDLIRKITDLSAQRRELDREIAALLAGSPTSIPLSRLVTATSLPREEVIKLARR